MPLTGIWSGSPRLIIASLAAGLLDLIGKGRKDLKKIANNTVVCNVKDGGIGIFVDGDDDVGAGHTGQMLDGTGDTASDVEFGTHGLSGLTHLMAVGDPAGVYGGAGGTHSGA